MSDTRKPIVIVGSITMDLVTRTPRIPAIGQTLIGTGFETTPGGKGANQAVAAARLGYRVAMVAKVGDDNFGPQLLDNLKHAGVDTNAMAQTTPRPAAAGGTSAKKPAISKQIILYPCSSLVTKSFTAALAAIETVTIRTAVSYASARPVRSTPFTGSPLA